MLVKDVLKMIEIECNDVSIVKGITFDSRLVKEGYIFLAYRGEKYNGNKYISDAFHNGAICVISDTLEGENIYKTKDIEKAKKVLCKAIYKLDKIKIIGITGTNGKTSTAHLIYQNLNRLGIRSTYIGTLGVIDGDYKRILDNTTPNMDILSLEISKAIERNCKYIVMEVSAHSLSLHRVDILKFDIVAFTNLSQDHLDFYGDLNHYFLAKKLLFDHADDDCLGIINSEDIYSESIIKDFKGKVIRYGSNSEYDYKILKKDLEGLIFKVNNEIVRTNLIYKTNLYNILLTYVVLVELGYDKNLIVNSISKSFPIEGRMQLIKNKGRYIILDYAHTPDAMERILKESYDIKKGKLIVLFGCGGNRDKTKRQLMGQKADKYADQIYLTNDNPRDEEDMDIIKDILNGISNNKNIIINLDRANAIKEAIDNMDKNDMLLVLGKGHEDYQEIKGQKKHFSDEEIIKSCIEK